VYSPNLNDCYHLFYHSVKNTNLPQEANYVVYKIAELAIVWLKSKVFFCKQ